MENILGVCAGYLASFTVSDSILYVCAQFLWSVCACAHCSVPLMRDEEVFDADGSVLEKWLTLLSIGVGYTRLLKVSSIFFQGGVGVPFVSLEMFIWFLGSVTHWSSTIFLHLPSQSNWVIYCSVMAGLERLSPIWFSLEVYVGAFLFRMHCCWILVGLLMKRCSAGLVCLVDCMSCMRVVSCRSLR